MKRKLNLDEEDALSIASEDEIQSNLSQSESDQESNNVDSGSECDSDITQEMINVDFAFNSPVESDYHALKNLLNQLFSTDAQDLELGSLADSIIALQFRATVIRADSNDNDDSSVNDPLAISCCIPLNDQSWCRNLKQFIQKKLKQSKDKQSANAFRKALESDQHCYIFISERLTNMPTEVAGPLSKLALDEVSKDNDAKYILYISKTYKAVKYTSMEDVNGDIDASDLPQFANEEDSVLSELAEARLTYQPKQTESSRVPDASASFYDGIGAVDQREVMLFTTDQFKSALSQVIDFCGFDPSQIDSS
ncbi:hypothetical protein MIR68_010604 [Amoeboaphelidium protococcarum]|nr:hypothetical protein MIR68_010604 [Amoeboaphelidium protococcarum]